ncbi:hypothetical protein AB0K62_23470 [Streptomyces halstedii]|uniref:hypothetical protein n=1 Tax=Streptomyces halstedii TaxID=1944 RepID=UPI00345F2CC9
MTPPADKPAGQSDAEAVSAAVADVLARFERYAYIRGRRTSITAAQTTERQEQHAFDELLRAVDRLRTLHQVPEAPQD